MLKVKYTQIIVDINQTSLKHPFIKFDLKFNEDVLNFLSQIKKKITQSNYKTDETKKFWKKYCDKLKSKNQITLINNKSNPIDLYRFMYLLNKLSKKDSILTGPFET